MLLRLTKAQVRRLKSEVLKDLANNRCSTENLRINCLEELTRRTAALGILISNGLKGRSLKAWG